MTPTYVGVIFDLGGSNVASKNDNEVMHELVEDAKANLAVVKQEISAAKLENHVKGVYLPNFIFNTFVNRLDPISYCENILRDHKPPSEKHLHPNQIELVRAACNPCIRQVAAMMSRQCLAKGTVIHTVDGKLTPIEEHPDAWLTRRDAEVIEINAHGGHMVRCTVNHPICTEDGWRPAGELKVGDRIVALAEWPSFTDRVDHGVRDLRLAELAGHLAATAHVTIDDGLITVVHHRRAVVERIKYLVRWTFPKARFRYTRRGTMYGTTFIYQDVAMRLFITHLGLTADGPSMRFINSLSGDLAAAFLRGLWNTSSSVALVSREPIQYNADLNVGDSWRFAQIVRELMLKLGVKARIKDRPCYTGYRVTFKGELNRRTFIDRIGKLDGRKFPTCVVARPRITWTEPTGEVLYLTSITSIRPAGTADVYDVTYPGKGWFIAGGIKVHNSGKTESISSICGYLLDNYPQMRIGVFTPKVQQAELDVGRLATFYQMNEHLINNKILKLNKGRIELSNGSFVAAVSASDQSNIEGLTFDVIVLDESQKISNYTWSERIAPMGGATNAKIIKVGTPKTRNHFYDSIYGANSSDWKVIIKDWTQCAQLWARGAVYLPDPVTGEIRPYSQYVLTRQMPKALKQSMFPNNPEVWTDGNMDIIDFRTQYMLEFIDGAGKFMTSEQMDKLKAGDFEWLEHGIVGERYVAGIDFAGSNPDGDNTHISVMRVNPDGTKNKVFAKEFEDTPYPQQMYEIARLFGGYMPRFDAKKIYADYTGCGAAIVQTLRDEFGLTQLEGIIFNKSDTLTNSGMNMKNIMYATFARDVDAGKVIYPSKERFTESPCASAGTGNIGFYHKMIGQWADLEATVTNTVNKKIEAPKGYHDDVCDADVLANFTTVVARRGAMPKASSTRLYRMR